MHCGAEVTESSTNKQHHLSRLVIRRAVEMESLQFVGCSWFIGLIGLVSDSPRINSPKTEHVCLPAQTSPVSSRPHLDAPGVHNVAHIPGLPSVARPVSRSSGIKEGAIS